MDDIRLADTADEEDRIRAVIAKRKLPESVSGFRIEFGTDSTGDPAVTVWLTVDSDPNPPRHVLDQTTKFVRETERDLMKLGLRHWPFVRFGLAAEAGQNFR